MHKRVFGFSAHFFINHLPDLPSGALNRDRPARQMNPGNGGIRGTLFLNELTDPFGIQPVPPNRMYELPPMPLQED